MASNVDGPPGRSRGQRACAGDSDVVPAQREPVEIEQPDAGRRLPPRLVDHLLGRLLAELGRPLRMAGVVGGRRRLQQQFCMIEVGARFRIGDGLPELQRAGEVLLGFRRGAGEHRMAAGGDRCRQRPRPVQGGEPVSGDGPDVLGLTAFERAGQAGVQTRAITGGDLVVDDLAAELVPEPDVITVAHQQGACTELVEHRT